MSDVQEDALEMDALFILKNTHTHITGVAAGKDNDPQVQRKKTDFSFLAINCIMALNNQTSVKCQIHLGNGRLIKTSLRYDVAF